MQTVHSDGTVRSRRQRCAPPRTVRAGLAVDTAAAGDSHVLVGQPQRAELVPDTGSIEDWSDSPAVFLDGFEELPSMPPGMRWKHRQNG